MATTRTSKGVLVALVAGVVLAAALTSSAAADDGTYQFRIVCKSGKVVIDTLPVLPPAAKRANEESARRAACPSEYDAAGRPKVPLAPNPRFDKSDLFRADARRRPREPLPTAPHVPQGMCHPIVRRDHRRRQAAAPLRCQLEAPARRRPPHDDPHSFQRGDAREAPRCEARPRGRVPRGVRREGWEADGDVAKDVPSRSVMHIHVEKDEEKAGPGIPDAGTSARWPLDVETC